MDSTETHYLSYDPDEILAVGLAAYMNAGGSAIRAGDEKEMLLQGVAAVIAQALAGVDNALRMDTLEYAIGVYLDLYGQKRNCSRIQAAKAQATAMLTAANTGVSQTIAAGTTLTQDGEILYVTDEDILLSGEAETKTFAITAEKEGSASNSLLAGATMQFLVDVSGVTSVVCTQAAHGGRNEEDDEAYRERIRVYGLSAVTTGPYQQYESVAEAVSSVILDAKAVNAGGGKVDVYVILSTQEGATALLQEILDALNPDSVRPLNDDVSVYQAEDVEYTLKVEYICDGSSATLAAIADATDNYQSWQDNEIGRAFNPDRLMAAIYQAGATRVTWGTGSTFNGGDVVYTGIGDNQRCKGTITLTAVPQQN